MVVKIVHLFVYSGEEGFQGFSDAFQNADADADHNIDSQYQQRIEDK